MFIICQWWITVDWNGIDFWFVDESFTKRSAVVHRHGYWCRLPGTVSVWRSGSNRVSLSLKNNTKQFVYKLSIPVSGIDFMMFV